MRTRLLTLVASLLLAVTACSSGSITGQGSRSDTRRDTTSTGTPQQQQAFGYGARPTGVDYQPDVVVVGGGAAAVRGATDDGLTWTIDAHAPNAGRLRVGSVLLMTSIVAGRVVALTDGAGTRRVTIAPVQLNEVLRNGRIDLHRAIDPATARFQLVPGLQIGPSTPTKDDLPSSFRAQAVTATKPLPPPSISPSFTIGEWKVGLSYSTKKIGATVEHNSTDGLKAAVDMSFKTKNLSIDGAYGVSNGRTTSSGFRINGITGFELGFSVGVGVKKDLGSKKVALLPSGRLSVTLPPGPETAYLPITFALKYKISLSFALGGANATLNGLGEYGLAGPIGIAPSGDVLAPKVSVVRSLTDSLAGLSLAPSGAVFAVNIKGSVGVGPSLFNAGPNAGVTVAVGVTYGSALGAPLTLCKSVFLNVDISGGASVEFDSSLVGVLQKVLPNTKLEFGLETKKRVVDLSSVTPKIPICGA
ncbi:MAG: hypothetical protein ACTHMS_14265 [Jatrophihabitans sp.]|uniref:hypothetical protein n=1 Tax=Jatrophihabitans sp. TaxID=1932789 RepID=UPI003F7CFCF2